MSSFKELRIVDNFYQTSSYIPMPTVLVSTLAEDGSTSVGAYTLCFPYYIAGKDYYALILEARNSSNTAQHLLAGRRADRAALFPSAGKAHGAAGRTGARRIRRNLRIHRHDVLRLRGAMRVAVVVRREAQAETARAAVRIRVRRDALHGLPVVQGFQRPAHELDRRDRQQRRSEPAALRRGAPAQGGSPKLQHG